MNMDIPFKVGTYQLNRDPNFNYQLNRLIMWNGGDLDEVQKISHKITDCTSWVREISALGEKALSENRISQACGYLRMAEFFMFHKDPNKMAVYDKWRSLFYEYYAGYFGDGEGQIKVERVPYETAYLPCWHVKPKGTCKDVILLHGGNDSSIEELLFPLLYFKDQGFEVYCFEGPGQGEVLKKCGIPFTYQWEFPVKAVLDYYDLGDVTIIGISLGGMFAPRAAAFEKRIRRVVAWSIMPNLLDVALATQSKPVQILLKVLLKTKQRWLLNCILNQVSKKNQMIHWALSHGKYAYGVDTTFEYFLASTDYDMLKIADRIDQDFLLIGASEDHFVDFNLYKPEIDALSNVHSLTFRVFNKNEHAENHCNAGNTKLVCDTILNWILSIKENSGQPAPLPQ